jgi:hypothetical protein
MRTASSSSYVEQSIRSKFATNLTKDISRIILENNLLIATHPITIFEYKVTWTVKQ